MKFGFFSQAHISDQIRPRIGSLKKRLSPRQVSNIFPINDFALVANYANFWFYRNSVIIQEISSFSEFKENARVLGFSFNIQFAMINDFPSITGQHHKRMATKEFNDWWKQFCRTGRNNPIRLGLTIDQVTGILGQPDDISAVIKNYQEPQILKLQKLEFHFGPGKDDP